MRMSFLRDFCRLKSDEEFLTVQLYSPKSSNSWRWTASTLLTTSWSSAWNLARTTKRSCSPWSHTLSESCLQSPGRRVLQKQRAVAQGMAVFCPPQRGVTLLVSRVPGKQDGAIQIDDGSHLPPGGARNFIRWELGTHGALGCCGNTHRVNLTHKLVHYSTSRAEGFLTNQLVKFLNITFEISYVMTLSRSSSHVLFLFVFLQTQAINESVCAIAFFQH